MRDKLNLFCQIEIISVRSLYITDRFVKKSVYIRGMRRICSNFFKLSQSKRREVKFSFKVFSKLLSEDAF